MATCFCIGPQNGEPLCPCQMANVKIQNGRYVKVEDLGPVDNNEITLDFISNKINPKKEK